MVRRFSSSSFSHVAVLGNALPRRCGLATYTSHSIQALGAAFPSLKIDHYAMDDGHGVAYGPDVALTVPADERSAYVAAAAQIGRSGAEIFWLHHEFGIFGGTAGDYILPLLRHIDIPVVVTLHTVLARPDADQMRVMRAIIARADRLIVMAREAARLLEQVYGADPRCIRIVPHGAPDRPLSGTRPLKAKLDLGDRPVILTFGLLSPGKGIETAIRALPDVVVRHPDLLYLVVGATHPTLLRHDGEAYRESLADLARALGMEDHVRFVDCFLENDDLLDHLQACDIYLTPYLGSGQVTSGTLSYALAMGRPVISTPYIHAREALAGGIGTLVPFGDAGAISRALLDHFRDPDWLAAQADRVWHAARPTIWEQNARRVMEIFSEARAGNPVALPGRREENGNRGQVQITGIAAATDDVGIIQHSIHGVPDRRHGYCIDDNARALRLLCETRMGDPALRRRLVLIYAAFVEHGWNREAGRFRNFMGYDRQWLEAAGSEDSNGRTLWTLGHVMRRAPDEDLRRWATELFEEALPLAGELKAPRAIAFATLGMAAVLDARPDHPRCRDLLQSSLALFKAMRREAARPDWPWFEPGLTYDNARLPQAMIEAARILGDRDAIAAALAALRWLIGVQTSPAGHFRPVGTEGFGRAFASPAPFDQQPLEATGTIEACLSAYRVDPDNLWVEAARRALAWFEGGNDLGMSLVGEDGTTCCDGLTREGVNRNRGAESILALQMARHAMAELVGEIDDTPQLLTVG